MEFRTLRVPGPNETLMIYVSTTEWRQNPQKLGSVLLQNGDKILRSWVPSQRTFWDSGFGMGA